MMSVKFARMIMAVAIGTEERYLEFVKKAFNCVAKARLIPAAVKGDTVYIVRFMDLFFCLVENKGHPEDLPYCLGTVMNLNPLLIVDGALKLFQIDPKTGISMDREVWILPYDKNMLLNSLHELKRHI